MSRWCWVLVAGLLLGCGKTSRDHASPDASTATIAPDAATCSMTVANTAELAEALDALVAPARICLEPGSYEGPFQLTDGVDLEGLGPGAVVTGLDVEPAMQRGVSLTGLELHTVYAGRYVQPAAPIRLRIENCRLNDVRTLTAGPGRLELEFEQCVVEDSVISIEHDFEDSQADVRISVQRSLCERCYPMVGVALRNSSGAVLPAGSRIDVDIANNLVEWPQLTALTAELSALLDPSDSASSRFWLRHNTIVNAIGAYGFFVTGTRIVVANNVIVDAETGIQGDSANFQNMIGVYTTGAAAWFEINEYTPRSTSPLLGTARREYAAASDYLGNPRDDAPDIGASNGWSPGAEQQGLSASCC